MPAARDDGGRSLLNDPLRLTSPGPAPGFLFPAGPAKRIEPGKAPHGPDDATCATKSTERATALLVRAVPAHFRITDNKKTTAMKTATSRRQAYRPIEPSWLTLGQACLLIMMVVLVQI